MSRFGDNNNGAPPTRIIRNNPTINVNAADSSSSKSDSQKDTVKLSDGVVVKDTKRILPDEPHSASDADGFRVVQDSKTDHFKNPSPSAPLEKPAPEFMNLKPVTASPKTRVFRSGADKQDNNKASDAPVVGWFVVVKGQGLGHSFEFSYGNNAIGRDASQGIAIDFGDEGISREAHAFVEYDPKARKCFLSKGCNLVYVNGDRVGQGSEVILSMGDNIELGETVLRFIPFCNAEFCWTANV
jgi:hypothetical protein